MGRLNINPVSHLACGVRSGLCLYGLVLRADSQRKKIQDFIQLPKQNP